MKIIKYCGIALLAIMSISIAHAQSSCERMVPLSGGFQLGFLPAYLEDFRFLMADKDIYNSIYNKDKGIIPFFSIYAEEHPHHSKWAIIIPRSNSNNDNHLMFLSEMTEQEGENRAKWEKSISRIALGKDAYTTLASLITTMAITAKNPLAEEKRGISILDGTEVFFSTSLETKSLHGGIHYIEATSPSVYGDSALIDNMIKTIKALKNRIKKDNLRFFSELPELDVIVKQANECFPEETDFMKLELEASP